MGRQLPGEALERWRNSTPEQRREMAEEKRRLMEEVWTLKASGFSYEQIAVRMGFDANTAWRLFQQMSKIMNKLEYSDIVKQRSEMVARIDRIRDKLIAQIDAGNTDLIEQYNKLDAQKARLLGLYAAVKVKMDHRVRDERTGKEEIISSDEKLFRLYERLKKRGKMTPDMEERFRRNMEIVDAEVVGEENATKEAGPTDTSFDIPLDDVEQIFPKADEP